MTVPLLMHSRVLLPGPQPDAHHPGPPHLLRHRPLQGLPGHQPLRPHDPRLGPPPRDKEWPEAVGAWQGIQADGLGFIGQTPSQQYKPFETNVFYIAGITGSDATFSSPSPSPALPSFPTLPCTARSCCPGTGA